MANSNRLAGRCGLMSPKDNNKPCGGFLKAVSYSSYGTHVVKCERCGSMVYGPLERKQDVDDAYPRKAV